MIMIAQVLDSTITMFPLLSRSLIVTDVIIFLDSGFALADISDNDRVILSFELEIN